MLQIKSRRCGFCWGCFCHARRRRSVSNWNKAGIPQYARAYLELRAEYIRLKRSIGE